VPMMTAVLAVRAVWRTAAEIPAALNTAAAMAELTEADLYSLEPSRAAGMGIWQWLSQI
jgi:hypothetical protein